MWFRELFPEPGELEHSSTPTGQRTGQREEKRAQGLISKRGCCDTMGGRTRASLKEEKLQKPSRSATRL